MRLPLLTAIAALALALAGCPEDPNGNGNGLGSDGGTFLPPPITDAGTEVTPDAGVELPINQTTIVTSVTPPSGAIGGGFRARIQGAGFTPGSRIFFGEVEADQVLFQAVDSMTARVPACTAPGPVDVKVVSEIGIGILEGGFVCFSPVTLESLAPVEGSIEGGTFVTATGAGLTDGMLVLVGGRQVAQLDATDDGTQATFLTPPGVDVARVDVEALDAFGRSVLDLGFQYTSAIRVDAVNPAAVDAGGVVVDVLGQGFVDTSLDNVVVTIGGQPAPRVNLISSTRLRVLAPVIGVGAYDVVVSRAALTDTLVRGFVVRGGNAGFSLIAALPERADAAGGTELTLVGNGLSTTTGVTVGGAACTGLVAVDDRTVTCTAPAGAVGATTIQLTRADLSTTSLAYTYFNATEIDAVAPATGPRDGGTAVTISGHGFLGATAVTFGGIAATDLVVVDDSTITVTTPAGAGGDVEVVVRNGAERGTATFRYQVPLRTLGVAPARGGISGHTFVTVRGEGFLHNPNVIVLFADTPAYDVTVVSDNLLTCRTPFGNSGLTDVTVATVPAAPISCPDDAACVAADATNPTCLTGSQGGNTFSGCGELSTASNAFTYFDPTSIVGGTRGGPIDGAVYVTALDAMTGFPVPGMVAWVGTDGEPIAAGLTNLLGQATISAPDVRGPQTVSVGGDGYSTATVFDVDASEVTVYLLPLAGGPPAGGTPPPPPPPATIRGRVFGFAKEFFDPAALDTSGCDTGIGRCEIALAVVTTTARDEFSGVPDPGADNVVFEEGGDYFIANSRPGRLALVALAGIFDLNNSTFRMRQMGVRREVFPQFGVNLEDQDIELTIPLDEDIAMSLPDAPLRFNNDNIGFQPTVTRVIPFIQFGGEGTLAYTQAVNGTRNHDLDTMPDLPGPMLTFVSGAYTTDGRNVLDQDLSGTRTVTVTEGEFIVQGNGTFWSAFQDPFSGTNQLDGNVLVVELGGGTRFAGVVDRVVDDTHLILIKEANVSASFGPYHIGRPGTPSSEVIQDGVGDLRGGVTIQPVLGLPTLMSPLENGVMENRQLRWKAAIGQQPSIHDMFVFDPINFLTVWEVFASGTRSKVIVPKMPELDAILAAVNRPERECINDPTGAICPLYGDMSKWAPPTDMVVGALAWQHEAIFVPNLDYQNWSYIEIGTRGRRSWTTDLHIFVHGTD